MAGCASAALAHSEASLAFRNWKASADNQKSRVTKTPSRCACLRALGCRCRQKYVGNPKYENVFLIFICLAKVLLRQAPATRTHRNRHATHKKKIKMQQRKENHGSIAKILRLRRAAK
jgi:hypothetical protein